MANTTNSLLDNYQSYDAMGLAELVKSKQVSPEELLEKAIAVCEQQNPAINAVVSKLYDHGRQQIANGLPEGAFTGVPFLLKDLLASLEGTPLSNGSNAYKGKISPSDSELVKRFKQAGLVIFGKTSSPEFGLMGITEPKAFGPCRNPWNTDHTPGGSSGGSGAAVAAGIVPMASGGDGGGSIRIPSACCGLFGLKPSRGRTPSGPYFTDLWDGAAGEHVLTRSVRDSAAVLDVVNGPDNSTPYPMKKESGYLECLNEEVRPLKIAYTSKSFFDKPVTQDAIDAVDDAVQKLKDLGHEVEEIELPINSEALAHSYLTMYFGHVAADMEFASQALGIPFKHLDVETVTKTMGYIGKRISAQRFVSAKRQWNEFAQVMGQVHQHFDMVLSPTLGSAPMKIAEMEPSAFELFGLNFINAMGLHGILMKTGMVEQQVLENLAKLPFTQLANLTGQPAMSVPLYWTKDKLPLGVQLMAPMGDEKTLLQLARQLEQAYPWFEKTAF